MTWCAKMRTTQQSVRWKFASTQTIHKSNQDDAMTMIEKQDQNFPSKLPKLMRYFSNTLQTLLIQTFGCLLDNKWKEPRWKRGRKSAYMLCNEHCLDSFIATNFMMYSFCQTLIEWSARSCNMNKICTRAWPKKSTTSHQFFEVAPFSNKRIYLHFTRSIPFLLSTELHFNSVLLLHLFPELLLFIDMSRPRIKIFA